MPCQCLLGMSVCSLSLVAGVAEIRDVVMFADISTEHRGGTAAGA